MFAFIALVVYENDFAAVRIEPLAWSNSTVAIKDQAEALWARLEQERPELIDTEFCSFHFVTGSNWAVAKQALSLTLVGLPARHPKNLGF